METLSRYSAFFLEFKGKSRLEPGSETCLSPENAQAPAGRCQRGAFLGGPRKIQIFGLAAIQAPKDAVIMSTRNGGHLFPIMFLPARLPR
jgi:hypothetical protein